MAVATGFTTSRLWTRSPFREQLQQIGDIHIPIGSDVLGTGTWTGSPVREQVQQISDIHFTVSTDIRNVTTDIEHISGTRIDAQIVVVPRLHRDHTIVDGDSTSKLFTLGTAAWEKFTDLDTIEGIEKIR